MAFKAHRFAVRDDISESAVYVMEMTVPMSPNSCLASASMAVASASAFALASRPSEGFVFDIIREFHKRALPLLVNVHSTTCLLQSQ